MLEQVVFLVMSLCPFTGGYVPPNTVLPAMMLKRGEPRGKLEKGETDRVKAACNRLQTSALMSVPTGIEYP